MTASRESSIPLTERLQFSFTRALPFQRQTETAECGLACLAMIASYHGYKTDIATLRKHFSLSLKGANLNQLVEIAASLHLAARAVRLDLDELHQLQLPCVLHWNLDHFVVLKKISRKGAVIHDPAGGVRTLTIAELSPHFTGVALELTPTHGGWAASVVDADSVAGVGAGSIYAGRAFF
jgi:ATP-binding cassette, subfamily B, bacterial CvaB/MchF/RaxB